MTKRTARGGPSNGHATPAQISVAAGTGLAALADQLAILENLYTVTFHAHAAAQKQVKAGPAGYTPEAIRASNDGGFLHEVNRRAHDMTDAIQTVILMVEPRTLDETLSLMLVYRQAMALYLCHLDEDPQSIKNEDMRDRERVLKHAQEGIIRGLVHGAGAKSPLLAAYAETGGNDAGGDLAPWDQQRQRAEKMAPRYLLNPQPQCNGEEAAP